ncbi:MAG: hypothetical protein ACOZEN_05945 [Thermodesulfobacteriota bacterium]
MTAAMIQNQPNGLARTGGDSPVLAGVAAFIFLLGVYRAWSAVMPLQQGRDFVTYMSWFVQFFRDEPVDHLLMLFRTPGAPLLFGGLDALGGPALVDAALNFLFAASLACLFHAVRTAWNGMAATAVLVLLALIPSYNWAWHTVASESLTCAGVALLMAATIHAFRAPRSGRWALLGFTAAVLALVRPSGLLTILPAVGALLIPSAGLRRRAILLGSALAPFVLLTGAWMIHNHVRYGEFVFARGGAAIIPAYRVFLWERIMKPENGPASRELAEAVARDLLPRKEYRDRQVDLDLFFQAGDSFMFADLIPLSDRAWGWDSNYSMLRRAAIEAIAAHPGVYLKGLTDTLWLVFSSSEHDIFGKARARWPEPAAVKEHKRRIGMPPPALPGNVEILSNSSAYWLASGSGRFPHVDKDFLEVKAREQDYLDRYPSFLDAMNFDQAALLVWIRLATASSWFFVLPLVGLLCFLERSPRASAVKWLYAVSAVILVVTYMGTDAVLQFRNPFDPVFALAAVAGVAAVRVSAPGPRQGAALHPPGG